MLKLIKKPSLKLNLICDHCNTIFVRYRIKSRPQRFCSRICFLKSDYHVRIQRKKMKERNWKAEKNPTWKGKNVSYKGIHRWMEINYGVAKFFKCSFCKGKSGSKKMNWANLDMKYTRDRKTWATLCKICHSNYDQKHFKIYSKRKALKPKISYA